MDKLKAGIRELLNVHMPVYDESLVDLITDLYLTFRTIASYNRCKSLMNFDDPNVRREFADRLGLASFMETWSDRWIRNGTSMYLGISVSIPIRSIVYRGFNLDIVKLTSEYRACADVFNDVENLLNVFKDVHSEVKSQLDYILWRYTSKICPEDNLHKYVNCSYPWQDMGHSPNETRFREFIIALCKFIIYN